MKFINIQVFTAFLLCAVCCVYANPKYCDSTSVDETARDACKDLMQKRSISELTQLGYVVEDVKAKHHRSRHLIAKKLTHASFPQGVFLLVHMNPRHVNAINEDSASSEMTNEILTLDLLNPEAEDRRHYGSNKFKRHTSTARSATQGHVGACCNTVTNCRRFHCT